MGGTAAAPGASHRPTRTPWWSVLLMIVVFYPPTLKPFALLTGKAPWEFSLTDAVAEGGPMREIQLTLLGLVGIGRLVFRRTGQSARAAPNSLGWLLVVFAVLIVASAMWSDEPLLSVRRLGALIMVVLAAFAYRRMPDEEFLRLVFFTTLAGLTFGLAKEVARGTFHPWDAYYRFTGTLWHPNLQGLNCALVLLSGGALVHAARRWKLAVTLVIPLACLLLTRSRTSLAAVFGAALFYAFLSLLRGRPLVLVGSLCLATMATLSAVWIGQSSPVLEDTIKLGREDSELATFEGRTRIWEEGLVFVRSRPWLGYGYDVFWSPDRIEEFSRTLGWTFLGAHSTYLDTLLGLGVIGLLLFVCILATGVLRASRVAVGSGNAADLFFAALLFFCALYGFLETNLIGPSFLTFLYMTALVRLGFRAEPAGRILLH
jgi:exopolysaccharide production protein ExoQ